MNRFRPGANPLQIAPMRKVGSTSAGSVLIEMTAAQYAALTQVMAPQQPDSEPEKPLERPVMALKRKQASVRNCLDKLRPDTRREVARSIKAMFSGNGGIREQEIDLLIESLVKDGYFSFIGGEKVRYAEDKPDATILGEQNNSPLPSPEPPAENTKNATDEKPAKSLLVEGPTTPPFAQGTGPLADSC